MQPKDFTHAFGVSHETMEKLEIYHALLFKWQKAINLVAPSTLQDSWQRHFADSAQLAQHISESTKTVADLGSGAGFPGLVLAIMRPDIEVHLVESDERKAQFLRTVSRETTAGCVIHNCRIEDLIKNVISTPDTDPGLGDPGLGMTAKLQPDLITARALASLKELCAYILPWAEGNPALEMLFLKGENAQAEIKEASAIYDFDHSSIPSLTAEKSTIVHLKALRIS